MIKTWSVFIRSNANGNQNDDMNVVAQHHRTFAGVVRGDSRERATVNAVQKTTKPAPFLLIYEGEVAAGEDAAFCPHCGKNLKELESGWKSELEIVDRMMDLEVVHPTSDPTYGCPHCKKLFKGKVETITRTMFFQVPSE